MADVALLAGAVALPAYCTRCACCLSCYEGGGVSGSGGRGARNRYESVVVALGLSFALLSLGILETLPPSWLLLLDSGRGSEWSLIRLGYPTLTGAYCLVLWTLSLLILVIFPCLAGTEVTRRCWSGNARFLASQPTAAADPDEEKKKAFVSKRDRGRFLGILQKVFSLLFKAFYLASVHACASLWRALWSLARRWRQQPQEGPIIALVNREDSLTDLSVGSGGGRRGLLLLGTSSGRGISFLGSACGIASTWTLLRFIAPLVIEASSSEAPYLSGAVSWLCALGILLSAALNGFGSVSMPHSCLAGLYLDPIPPEIVACAEAELRRVQESVVDRRADLSTIGLSISPTGSGTWKRMKFSDLGEEVVQRRKQLLGEIEFLETLAEEIQEDAAEMRYSQEMAAAARTTLGRLRSWLGVVFSVVLLLRLFSAAVVIWFQYNRAEPYGPSPRRVDPVTVTLSWLLGHAFVTQQDYNRLSQLISLSLTAILSVSQVRTFLRTVKSVHRRLHIISRKLHCGAAKGQQQQQQQDEGSPPSASTSALYSHVLASFMGCYFIACVVLTKMMLPERYRAAFSAALGGGADIFRIRSYAVNLAFALSAVVSSGALGMLLGIQRQNTYRFNTAAKTWPPDEGKVPSTNANVLDP